MNIAEFAKLLDGREYTQEMTQGEEKLAEELGFVVVFGYSDDGVELRGAICDEAGCYDGGTIYLDRDGLFESREHDHYNTCKYIKAAKEKCKTIEAIWDSEGYSWIYKTDIPHATFEIYEDGEKYCRGIVFDLRAAFKEDRNNMLG